jgi:hypothetical protein
MLPPKHRPIAAGLACLIAVVPIITIGTMHGKTQGVKTQAETDRQARLEAVSKAFLSENCYITKDITVGAEFPVKGHAQTTCIAFSDGSRFGFIEYQKEILTVTDAFSRKEVNSKISTLGAKSNARN